MTLAKVCVVIILLCLCLCKENLCAIHRSTQNISLGPECYYLKRMKAGGAWQSGTLAGVYGSYERIKSNALYCGLFGSYARGRITGETGSLASLVSDFSDLEFEGRLGYTIRDNNHHRSLFTPFIGLGLLRQMNSYLPPTPLTVTFRDIVKYFSYGFLSEIQISKRFSIGLNIILKWMLDGKCDVLDSPTATDDILIMENELQYLVEVPIVYRLSQHKKVFTLSCVPFYQFRHYGGRENYPYDFIDTKFRIYGVRLLCDYWF